MYSTMASRPYVAHVSLGYPSIDLFGIIQTRLAQIIKPER